MSTVSTHPVHPLRRVVDVTESEESGTDLGPHHFWTAHRYDMTLECGHTTSRIKDNLEHLNAWDMVPERVRCKECEPHMVADRPRPVPTTDALAVEMARVAGTCGVDPAGTKRWMDAYGSRMDDEAVRARVYRAVASELDAVLVGSAYVVHADALRQALDEWAASPSEEVVAAVRKARRRVYDAQHRGGDWYAARAMVCVGSFGLGERSAARCLAEALTWTTHHRGRLNSRLFAQRILVEAHADVLEGADGVGERAQAEGRLTEARADMEDTMALEQPAPGAGDEWVVEVLMDAYALARMEAGGA